VRKEELVANTLGFLSYDVFNTLLVVTFLVHT